MRGSVSVARYSRVPSVEALSQIRISRHARGRAREDVVDALPEEVHPVVGEYDNRDHAQAACRGSIVCSK